MVVYYNMRCIESNFNPRPPRGGRRRQRYGGADPRHISIHAPREGGDRALELAEELPEISIHAPREGGDSAIAAAASPSR